MVRRALVTFSILLWSAVGYADPPFRLFKDYLWVRDGATNAQQRSVWAEDNTLTVGLPKLDLPAVEKDYHHPIIRRVRIVQAQGRTELLLDVKEPAKQLASKLMFATEGDNLRIQWQSEEPATKVTTLVDEVRQDDKNPPEPVKVATRTQPAVPQATKISAAATLTTGKPAASDRGVPTVDKNAATPSSATNADDNKPFWQKATTPIPREHVGGTIWTGAFFGLAIAFAAAGWLMKRRRKQQLTATPDIEVLSSRTINSRQRLLLVRAAGKTLLLASTEKNVRVLSSSKDEAQPAPPAREEPRTPITLARAPEPTPTIEEPPRAAMAPVRPAKPAFRPSQPITESFMKRLSEQMAKKREEEASALEQPNWAEGILKMRESREQRVSPTRPRHQTRLIG